MRFYETPLFIDVLLYVIYALIAVAIVLSVWSSVRSLLIDQRQRRDARAEEARQTTKKTTEHV